MCVHTGISKRRTSHAQLMLHSPPTDEGEQEMLVWHLFFSLWDSGDPWPGLLQIGGPELTLLIPARPISSGSAKCMTNNGRSDCLHRDLNKTMANIYQVPAMDRALC